MKYLLILLFGCLSLQAYNYQIPSAKYFTVRLDECDNGDVFEISYSDDDSNGVFDRLIINDCGGWFEEELSPKMTEGGPSLEIYNDVETWLEVSYVNYNNVKEDAYFRVYVMQGEVKIGYWEHNMGTYKLIWKVL